MTENVNHPIHYQREGRKECIEEIKDKYGMTIQIIFCLTNAYKYLYRAGLKHGSPEKQDIAKAKWYFDYLEKTYHIDEQMRLKYFTESMKEFLDEDYKRTEGNYVLDLYFDIKRGLKKYEDNKTKL